MLCVQVHLSDMVGIAKAQSSVLLPSARIWRKGATTCNPILSEKDHMYIFRSGRVASLRSKPWKEMRRDNGCMECLIGSDPSEVTREKIPPTAVASKCSRHRRSKMRTYVDFDYLQKLLLTPHQSTRTMIVRVKMGRRTLTG